MKETVERQFQRAVARWRNDPLRFLRECVIDPDTRSPFQLYAEQADFLRRACTLRPDGRVRYSEVGYCAPKKSGKTTTAALVVLYTAFVLAPLNGEIYLLANDQEQAVSRVFKIICQILEASPLLRGSVAITQNKITIRSTGTTIMALPNDYRGFAGSNPTLNAYDESAYYTSEASRRLWDEGMPSPARRLSFRLSVSTAGFEGEPSPLKDLYDRVVVGGKEIGPDLHERDNALVFWSHRSDLAPSSESIFIALSEWDAITEPGGLPIFSSASLDCYVGIDASLKHDSTAIASVAWVDGRLRLINLRTFQPSPSEPLDFENTVERELLDWKARYRLREVRIDPWQMAAVAQRLRKQGVNMVEYPQSLPNLSAMASNLFELVRSRMLNVYPDVNLRRAVAQAVAVEGARGWKIDKTKQSHKIDPLIALAMAALAAVERKNVAGPLRGFTFGSSPWEALYAMIGSNGLRVDGIPGWDLGFTTKDGKLLTNEVKSS
jgi:phage terminase large subunit-like protein